MIALSMLTAAHASAVRELRYAAVSTLLPTAVDVRVEIERYSGIRPPVSVVRAACVAAGLPIADAP